MRGTKWTQSEELKLTKLYADSNLTVNDVADRMNRTRNSVALKASQMKLEKATKFFEQAVTNLKGEYGDVMVMFEQLKVMVPERYPGEYKEVFWQKTVASAAKLGANAGLVQGEHYTLERSQ